MTHADAHELARTKGVNRLLYAVVKALLGTYLRIVYRLHIGGAQNIPREGAAIIAPNHKSFWDSFFIALATPRHLRFMGKAELFEGWKGPLLVRLGAFPVKRGESDAEALETARQILKQGGLLSLFPEGTRVRDPETLGSPKRGAARLAIEANAPLVPCAITGSEKLFIGPFPRPTKVQVAFAEPVPVAELEATPESAAELIDHQVWPEVQREYGRLKARPTLAAAAVAALGLGGLAVSRSRGAGKKKKKKTKKRRR